MMSMILSSMPYRMLIRKRRSTIPTAKKFCTVNTKKKRKLIRDEDLIFVII